MTDHTRLKAINADLLAALELAEISLQLLATEQTRYNKRRPSWYPKPTNHIEAWETTRAAIVKARGK